MDNTKKMILIEPDVLERLKTKENIFDDSLSRLDKEMQKILKSKIDDREKWALYMQVLQKYLHLIQEDKKPLKLPITFESVKDNTNENKVIPFVKDLSPVKDVQTPKTQDILLKHYTVDYLNRLIPKTYKKKGKILIDTLLKNRDTIYWNDDGTVVINNEHLPQSNIIDLVNITLRPLKIIPDGWEKFAEALKDIKVPLICVGNPEINKYMNILYVEDFRHNTPTKLNTPKLSTSRRKIDWERWTPY